MFIIKKYMTLNLKYSVNCNTSKMTSKVPQQKYVSDLKIKLSGWTPPQYEVVQNKQQTQVQ